MDKRKISLIIISFVLGLMLAIQYNSVNNKKVVRDTRSQWELRENLMKEKEIHSRLLNEIRSNEEKLAKYETEWKQSKEKALHETLNELKTEIGLTEVNGPGIILRIEPLFSGYMPGIVESFISPELLQQLINELNMYGAKHISVADQRVVNTTVIREINGDTKIDGVSLRHFPIEILIVTDDEEAAEKLYNRMLVSQSIESFYIDNLQVKISKPATNLKVPAYGGVISIRGMESVKQEKGGSS